MTAPEPGPITTAVAGLRDFAQQASGGSVDVGAPVDGAREGLWLWPYELRPQVQTTGSGARHPYRLGVRCVLAGTGPDALGLLDRVLTAAVRAGTPELVIEPPSAAWWQAAGLAPRPALVFEVLASVTHPAPHVPSVRGPLVLKQIELRPLAGVLLGPGDQPVAAARVEVAGSQLSCNTDGHGRFSFPGIPVADRVTLRVVGRGRVFTAIVPLTGGEAEPVTVHCDFGEPADAPPGARRPDPGG